jgi:hypothetical protein
MKATRTVGLVILLFVMVWLPFLIRQLFYISEIFAGEWDMENAGLSTLTYCNGAVNFFVYSCRDPNIRKALYKMLRCKTSVSNGELNFERSNNFSKQEDE